MALAHDAATSAAPKKVRMIINGEETDAASGEELTVEAPGTRGTIAAIPRGGAEDVNRAVLGLYHTVGIGMGPAVAEEALFRGFLNNHFSHHYGRWGGLALSSALFAIGHLGEGNQADALTAGLFGAYVGLLQQRNGYAIGEGVAIHFWTNFLAGLTALSHGGPAEDLLTFTFSF